MQNVSSGPSSCQQLETLGLRVETLDLRVESGGRSGHSPCWTTGGGDLPVLQANYTQLRMPGAAGDFCKRCEWIQTGKPNAGGAKALTFQTYPTD